MGKSSNPTFAGDKEFEKIHLKEKFSYGLGDVACNVVFALTTSLLIYFYTNVVGISAAMIGTIMLISRFFDGISDVLIGHLVDRTHSKHGKSRAWILWMMIPYGIAAILLFTVPPATQIVKGIYVFITYNFCTTVVYTALNLPYATLATLMTRDTDQRAVVNLFRTGIHRRLGYCRLSGSTLDLTQINRALKLEDDFLCALLAQPRSLGQHGGVVVGDGVGQLTRRQCGE